MQNTRKVTPPILFLLICSITPLFAQTASDKGYILEKENEISKLAPGPHSGGGTTVGFSFFNEIKDLPYVFRKRILKPGSGIGYHKQEENEIYYILSGKGEMKMNDEVFTIDGGTAILTLAGSSHGLKQMGDQDLVIFIIYEK